MNAAHPGSCTDIPPESPAAPGVFGARSLAARLRSLPAPFPGNSEPQDVLGSDLDEGCVASPESEIPDVASPVEGQPLHGVQKTAFSQPIQDT
jgi:hypothetical protein